VEVSGANECGQIVSHALLIHELNGTLGEFDIILPSEDRTGCGVDHIQIGKVQIELDMENLRPSAWHWFAAPS
jgi:hypothetical protein